jgi:hypothetical protein
MSRLYWFKTFSRVDNASDGNFFLEPGPAELLDRRLVVEPQLRQPTLKYRSSFRTSALKLGGAGAAKSTIHHQ